MIRDRGNIKWAGMMLTEHNVELKHWLDKEYYIERPELSEWDLQSIQEEIEVACKRKCETRVNSWKEGRIYPRQGVIVGIDLQEGCLLLDDPFGVDRLPISEVVGVQCVE